MFTEDSVREEVERLDRLLREMDEVRDDTNRRAKSKEGLNGMPWPVFARRMRVLTSQSSGPKLEAYFIGFYGWEPVSSKLDRGDACEVRLDETGKVVLDADGEPVLDYYEIKASFITGRNKAANFVQLRPWQDIAGYRCFVVLPDYSVVRFDLTKTQMDQEILRIGGLAHGTTGAVANHDHKEKAVRPKYLSKDWDRWMNDYRSDATVPSD